MPHTKDYDHYSCMEDFIDYTIVADTNAIGVIGTM